MTPTKADVKPEGESGHVSTHDPRTRPDPNDAGFTATLRALREERRWSLQTLADRMHYSRPYVSKVEAGTDPVPRTAMFAQRADAALAAGGRLVAAWERHWSRAAPDPVRPLTPATELVETYDDVQAALWSVVDEASRFLVCAGSRSRDEAYLRLIEDRLRVEPQLAYTRILFGPPRHAALRDHLLRVIEIRDPGRTASGAGKSVFLSMFDDINAEPERFVCANEHRTVLPQLSLNGLSLYDTAFVVNDAARSERWAGRLKEAYYAGRRIETDRDIRALPIGGMP